MNRLSIALLVATAVAAAGCEEKGGEDMLAKLAGFRDQICACKDKACTERLTAELTRWSQDGARAGTLQNLNNDDLKRSTAISEEVTRCVTKIVADSVGASGTPGPAGAGTASGAPTAAGSGDGAAGGAPPAGSAEGAAAAPPAGAGSAR